MIDAAWNVPQAKVISETLLPALAARFLDRRLRIGVAPAAVATFPAADVAVGDVVIWDDGDELTLAIGDITHGHFNRYGETLTESQAAERITEDIIAFLEYLFDDQVLLWKSTGGSGGWRIIDDQRPSLPSAANVEQFLWSGRVNG